MKSQEGIDSLSLVFSSTRTRKSEGVYFGIAAEQTRLEQGIFHFPYKKQQIFIVCHDGRLRLASMLEYERDCLWEVACAECHGRNKGPSVVARRSWCGIESFEMSKEFWCHDIGHNFTAKVKLVAWRLGRERVCGITTVYIHNDGVGVSENTGLFVFT